MDSIQLGRVALMSIHPEFAEAILSGRKTVEFRKRPIGDDVTHVIVYATAPTAAVVGAFTVAGQATDDPRNLWQTYADVAGISQDRFFAYFAGRPTGTGIHVGRVFISRSPLRLSDGLGLARPPQSYQYVEAEAARMVLSSMRPA